MAESLRDQLLRSGIVKQVKKAPVVPVNRSAPAPPGKGRGGVPAARSGGKQNGEIDLAKAYAIRARVDTEAQRRAQQEAAEQARIERERKQKLQRLLTGKSLNKKDAEHTRHFEYGGKIRRVYVDAEQLAA